MKARKQSYFVPLTSRPIEEHQPSSQADLPTTQAPDRSDILNVGGFSDAVFQVVAMFFTADPSRFVAEVELVEL